MHTFAKIAGSALFGGALVVGTAGMASAQGGTDGGSSQPQGTSQTSPDQGTNQSPDQGTNSTAPGDTQGSQDSNQSSSGSEDSTQDSDGSSRADNDGTVDRDGTPPRPDNANVADGDNDTDDSATATTGPRDTTGSSGATSPNGSSVTPFGTTPSGTTPPAFCADSAMLQRWFAEREAAVAQRITALGQAEGTAAANGKTSTVQAGRARVSQLNAAEAFLRAADAQLTSVCGTA